MSKIPIQQPRFDNRIYSLAFPLTGGRSSASGILRHGFMVWEKPLAGYSGLAAVHFLYNPSVVEADYPISDSSVGAILQFPVPGDSADLRVPLQQTVSWSLLFDRTYELWGSADDPEKSPGTNGNDPSVVGVMSDIYQMRQFTGMEIGYSSVGLPSGTANTPFAGHQGIVQIVPSYVYFGLKTGLLFYGYISEWDVQVTHWTQRMIPMRCVINITFTMLPSNTSRPGTSADSDWLFNPRLHGVGQAAGTQGISGR